MDVQKISILITFIFLTFLGIGQGDRLRTNNGQVRFTSDAPLELIQAESKELLGILDMQRAAFAFKVNIRSFDGFNSPLQKEHFYENYMEVTQYPEATFEGKLIEPLSDLSTQTQNFRAKGIIDIHGVKKEIIIPVALTKEKMGISFQSEFTVSLKDHNIHIPKIVYQKIASEIVVSVLGTLNQ